mgnify:FL=1
MLFLKTPQKVPSKSQCLCQKFHASKNTWNVNKPYYKQVLAQKDQKVPRSMSLFLPERKK